MKRTRKPEPTITPAQTAALDRIGEQLDALPHERREAFVRWLEREHGKATRPRRAPGRPRLMDEPMTASVTIKVPPAMRAEIRAMADAFGCRNEAEYLRRLHQAFVRLDPLRGRKRREGSRS